MFRFAFRAARPSPLAFSSVMTNHRRTSSSSSVPPPPNRPATTDASTARPPLSEDDLAATRRLIALLETDSKALEAIVASMNPESRRRLVIAGGAAEWFGKERIDAEVLAADADKDQFISPKDFDNWFASALKRCPEPSPQDGRGGAAGSTSSIPAAAVPFSALALIALEAGLPFVGFGFLDNATMILAGDAIDQSVGWYLHCSVMASAAMGNVVSGVMGMQVHGLVEKLIHKLHLPTPLLTDAQRESQRVFMAGHLGGTLGIAIGLTLGMLPLLVIRDEEDKVDGAVFATLDANSDGCISATELRRGLQQIGLDIDAEMASGLIGRYAGEASAMNFEQFQKLCADLRTHQDEQRRANKRAAA